MGEIIQKFNEAFRDFNTDKVPSTGLYEVRKSIVRQIGPIIEETIDGAAAGNVKAETWAVLNAIAPTRNGQPAFVLPSDGGTHTDPVVGGTVNNAGEYRGSLSPLGWKRIGDYTTTEISDVDGLQDALDDKQDLNANLTAVAGLTSAANKLPYFTGSGTAALADLTAAGRAILDDATAADQRTTLGLSANGSSLVTAADYAAMRALLDLEPGTDVQAQSARLQDIAANLSATSGTIEKTAANTFGTYTVTAAGKALIDDADAAAQRATLGLAIGTNVQAQDADLQKIADMTIGASQTLVMNGAGTGFNGTDVSGYGIKFLNWEPAGASEGTFPYVTAGNAIAAATISSNGRTFVAGDYATMKGLLNLEIGTDVQAQDADLSALAAISSAGILTHVSAGVAAARTITGTSGQITVTNGNGFAGNPEIGISDNAFTFAKMQDIATDRLIGRDTAGTGNPEEITVGGGIQFSGSGGIERAALSGDVTAAAGSNTTVIADNAVTNAKAANMNNGTIKARVTSGAGDPEDITAAQARALLNVADGASANSPDATLLARGNHTGTQAISTIVGLQTALDGKADEADLVTEIADREAADNAITAALATKTDLATAVQTQNRPGDVVSRFTDDLTGTAAAAGNSAGAATNNTFGAALRVTGAAVVGTRERIAVEADRRYRVRWAIRRQTNPTDPAGDTVRRAIQWLTNTKADNGQLTDPTLDIVLTTAMSRQVLSIIIGADDAVEGVDFEWPTGTRYMVPFVETFGSDGVTDIELIEWMDITDLEVISGDAAAVTAEVVTARHGEASLSDNLTAMKAATAAVTAEVTDARQDAGTLLDNMRERPMVVDADVLMIGEETGVGAQLGSNVFSGAQYEIEAPGWKVSTSTGDGIVVKDETTGVAQIVVPVPVDPMFGTTQVAMEAGTGTLTVKDSALGISQTYQLTATDPTYGPFPLLGEDGNGELFIRDTETGLGMQIGATDPIDVPVVDENFFTSTQYEYAEERALAEALRLNEQDMGIFARRDPAAALAKVLRIGTGQSFMAGSGQAHIMFSPTRISNLGLTNLPAFSVGPDSRCVDPGPVYTTFGGGSLTLTALAEHFIYPTGTDNIYSEAEALAGDYAYNARGGTPEVVREIVSWILRNRWNLRTDTATQLWQTVSMNHAKTDGSIAEVGSGDGLLRMYSLIDVFVSATTGTRLCDLIHMVHGQADENSATATYKTDVETFYDNIWTDLQADLSQTDPPAMIQHQVGGPRYGRNAAVVANAQVDMMLDLTGTSANIFLIGADYETPSFYFFEQAQYTGFPNSSIWNNNAHPTLAGNILLGIRAGIAAHYIQDRAEPYWIPFPFECFFEGNKFLLSIPSKFPPLQIGEMVCGVETVLLTNLGITFENGGGIENPVEVARIVPGYKTLIEGRCTNDISGFTTMKAGKRTTDLTQTGFTNIRDSFDLSLPFELPFDKAQTYFPLETRDDPTLNGIGRWLEDIPGWVGKPNLGNPCARRTITATPIP